MNGVALAAGKAVLVTATVVCLLSMGGAMLFAWPVLVPLHLLAARTSPSPYRAGAWGFLAAASVFEAAWMTAYAVTDDDTLSALVGGVLAAAFAYGFLRLVATLRVRA